MYERHQSGGSGGTVRFGEPAKPASKGGKPVRGSTPDRSFFERWGRQLRLRAIGAGAVMTLSLAGVVSSTPTISYAASCYTGCHTSPPKTAGGKPTISSKPSSGGSSRGITEAHALAFTGANVLVPAGIGAGGAIVGGVLMFTGRRRRHLGATVEQSPPEI